MSSLYAAISAIVPMLLLMGLGIFLRRINMIGGQTLPQLSTLCFRVFLTSALYYNIYNTNIAETFNGRLILFVVAAHFVMLGLGFLLCLPFEKTNKRRGALWQGMFHTNTAIFTPLVGTALLGEGNLGSMALIIAVSMTLQNVLSVLALELCRENRAKANLGPMLLSVLRNPYIVAAAAGFLTNLAGITLPGLLANTIRDLARCATPVALIVMGAFFSFTTVKGNLKSICASIAGRLIIVPLIMVPASILLGFRGVDLLGLMCIFSAPVAISSFNLALAMEADADLTSQMIVFTSICSSVTIFAWIYLLSEMALI